MFFIKGLKLNSKFPTAFRVVYVVFLYYSCEELLRTTEKLLL
jgi:hypothetical protein